ncbi:MAG: hypothetical protein Q7S89_01200 [bacterium]|nr:hypothetical protein [bacterium]
MFTRWYSRLIPIAPALLIPGVALAEDQAKPGLGSIFSVLDFVGRRTCGDACVNFASQLQNDPFATIAGQIIGIVLGFLGLLLLGLLIYGGFVWMTARGEEEKVEQAKQIITRAVVGIVIIMVSYAVSFFILWSLAQVTTQPLPPVD